MFFKIELVKKVDIKNVFELSNDFIVRRNSFNFDKINWTDHIIWFNKVIRDRKIVFYVIKTKKNRFVGQVRFNLVENTRFDYIVNISLIKDFRGKGLGSKVLKIAIKKIKNDFDAHRIFAYIKDNNKASIKCFLKNDFKIYKNKIINGFNSTKMIFE